MSPPEDKPATGDLFDSIGHQVQQVDAPAATAAAESDAATTTPDADEPRVVEEIESLCMNCHENGMTRLLLTRIPYFREIIVMSFACEHCGFRNNEIQAAGSVQPRGCHYELRLTDTADLSRQVVKADSATAKFIELDVEVPAGRGQLTNVEGLLSGLIDDLAMDQEARRQQQPEVYAKIAEVLAKAQAMLAGTHFPFRLSIDDPAGNSWITPDLHDGVGKWEKREYLRTPAQNEALGLTDTTTSTGEAGGETTFSTGIATDTGSFAGIPSALPTSGSDGVIPLGGQGRLGPDDDILPNEVYTFPASCPACMHPCITHMKMVDIPHFQQVVLMNTLCDHCGYRSNDVKTGGAIPARGRRISLRVRTPADLARDILKSESCALTCPELNLDVNPGTLGGRFTTVEGLLTQVRDDLKSQIFQTSLGGRADADAAAAGDSLDQDDRARWTAFFDGLDAAIAGHREFTIVLQDPLASSYVQSLADDPREPDAQMTVAEYDRTDEEEEELGLKDMKTEGYEAPEKEAEAAEKKGTDDAAGPS